jgi:hypothetical protein
LGVVVVDTTGCHQAAGQGDGEQNVHPRVHGGILPHGAQMQTEISLAVICMMTTIRAMFSHIVAFWTVTLNRGAADELLAGANKLLKNIPGVLQFHAGKMVRSRRSVVEQRYQVALNLTFADKQAERAYQAHPQHAEFAEKYVKRLVKKVVVYDFE